jgi:hypothetical protein
MLVVWSLKLEKIISPGRISRFGYGDQVTARQVTGTPLSNEPPIGKLIVKNIR